ncbi:MULTISPECIES: gamma carbonic anhydrase family protein [unclassified Acinetobacter]|uniref:gamma carbonic anhydrase family protein n=1 Tax=unclassified Acinetobacter TaxID=196816 RepID=UPI002934C0F7|nr:MULTISPECIES: gamma carbonic anhydrase family protein [unclassified Acinetobacter]WOE31330.1 gamma carbonic anhydrase family protein [Acinetobacter sp. SAAs470]WOE39526.1 gamma carbonic anhydrase family protein [Acinetobacter sp. SAAs474]
MLYKFKDFAPYAIHQPWDGWVAENATVIGQVALGRQVSIWFGAVVRADNAKISLGNFTNVQENAVLHTDADIDMLIGDYVTIGHQAMLHGCTIGENSLIGINAVVLNHAVIGRNCIIGANALIPEGKVIPDNSVVMGSPGKVVKTLDATAAARLKISALHYAEHFKHFQNLQQVQL